jgi:hypothetical protein
VEGSVNVVLSSRDSSKLQENSASITVSAFIVPREKAGSGAKAIQREIQSPSPPRNFLFKHLHFLIGKAYRKSEEAFRIKCYQEQRMFMVSHIWRNEAAPDMGHPAFSV